MRNIHPATRHTRHTRHIHRGAAVVVALTITLAAPAHADPDEPNNDTTKDVCGAFNMGVPPDQIAQGLERNDHRFNQSRAWNTTIWPIIEGDCDS